MRTLKPNNRDRLHMKDERRDRDLILSRFVQAPPIEMAHVFVGALRGTRRKLRDVRSDCLRELAQFAADNGATRIVVESCSQDKQDLAVLVGALAAKSAENRVRVVIDKPTSHELLWAADLVAWAYGAGGPTRDAVSSLVTVHHLP